MDQQLLATGTCANKSRDGKLAVSFFVLLSVVFMLICDISSTNKPLESNQLKESRTYSLKQNEEIYYSTNGGTTRTEIENSQIIHFLYEGKLVALSPPQPATLPFQEWEINALGDPEHRTCHPPNDNIPEFCCLGSSSQGGDSNWNVNLCANSSTVEIHKHLADITFEYLNENQVIEPNHQLFNTASRSITTSYNISQTSSDERRRDGRQPLIISNHGPHELPQQDCDICRIIDYLMIYNWTLSFQGDSVMRQTFVGLECELHRHGYIVHVTEKTNTYPRREPVGWRYGIGSIKTLTITHSYENALIQNLHSNVATIQFYGLYRPITDNDEILDIVVQNTDILVFDHGLHWLESEANEFQEAMITLLDAFKQKPTIERLPFNSTSISNSDEIPQGIQQQIPENVGQGEQTIHPHTLKMVAWRQTTAQHFKSPSGHYPGEGGLFLAGCVPIDPANDIEGYRLSIMEKVAKAAEFIMLNALDPNFQSLKRQSVDELIFLPYREFTFPLHYLHPDECTHFCHDPNLWLPIWRSLRIAVDRAVRIHELEK
jgi:hypothetical protein